jgi:hypothetical protein
MYDTANQPIWQVILNEAFHFDGVAGRSWRQQMHWPDMSMIQYSQWWLSYTAIFQLAETAFA